MLAREDAGLVRRMEVIFAGRRSERDEALLARYAHLANVRHIGHVSRAAAISLQRSADALVLITGDATAAVTGKLFEYLGAGRPILHLGREGAAARILQETAAGVTIPHDDVRAISEQLRQIAQSEFGSSVTLRNLERYSYPCAAERMAEVLERAISAARERAR
jgi:glycosyltransferase involved in cell wall biosynthesis